MTQGASALADNCSPIPHCGFLITRQIPVAEKTHMGLDLEYFEKRVRSLEQALHRLQADLEDAHRIAGGIVSEYKTWRQNETPTRELMYRRLDELKQIGRPRCVFAKTLIFEYGVSRTKAYQMVRDYLHPTTAHIATP